jgi:hypothetical protein
MTSRKGARPSRFSIERAKNGGYVVNHSFDNVDAGESYRGPETHVFADHKTLLAHLRKQVSPEDEQPDVDEAKVRTAAVPTKNNARAGVGRNMPGPHPGRRTYGAGVD